MKRILGKIAVYALLISGALVFLVPLLWMISTGLKPIDQTLSMPPTWIPYQVFVETPDGVQQVRSGEVFVEPCILIEELDSGRISVHPQDTVQGLELVQQVGGETRTTPIRRIRDIPAGHEEPWVAVTRIDAPDVVWDVVPESRLIRKTAPRWSNFVNAVRAMKAFPLYLKNTLILCVLTVIGTVLSSALAAYGFSRIEWKGRNKVFLLALGTMMVPFAVTMVPVYALFRSLGWIGTLRPLWVGSFFAGAFNVFLLRQFFLTLPKDLTDAARIDGCGELRIFWQIVLPLSRPALMVVGLFQFMGTWNDFMGPLIYLTNQKDFTLALGLQFFQSQHGGTEWHYLMAASTVVAVPIIILYFFTQRSFIEGISMTGIKG